MALTFDIFSDAALTTPYAGTIPQAADGSTGAVNVPLWIGSATADRILQVAAAPGVTALSIAVADSSPADGQPASSIRLALTEIGLDSATPGASLNLGTHTLASGLGNKIAFWMRVQAASLVVGTYTDLSLSLPGVLESPT